MADALLNEQTKIFVYNPKVSAEQYYSDLGTRSPEENRQLVTVISNHYEAMQEAYAVAVLTEWDAFKNYDSNAIYKAMLQSVFIFDGRVLLNDIYEPDLI